MPEATTETPLGPPGGSRFPCPLLGCDWYHDEPAEHVPPGALAGVFGFGVMGAVAANQRAQRVEDAMRAHFDGHELVDFLRTITGLQNQVAALEHDEPAGDDPWSLVRVLGAALTEQTRETARAHARAEEVEAERQRLVGELFAARLAASKSTGESTEAAEQFAARLAVSDG